jgi:hypothetical protein
VSGYTVAVFIREYQFKMQLDLQNQERIKQGQYSEEENIIQTSP